MARSVTGIAVASGENIDDQQVRSRERQDSGRLSCDENPPGTDRRLSPACGDNPVGGGYADSSLAIANALREHCERIVVLGEETHGTQEVPALVADLACRLVEDERVLVGVEVPRWLNEDIMAFVAGELDQTTLLTAERPVVLPDGTPLEGSRQALWHLFQDGRTSQAMLDLLWHIRQLVAAGRQIDVLAFDDVVLTFEGEEEEREPTYTRDEMMARNVAKAWSAAAYGHTLVLTGKLHARRSPVTRRTMVDWLPAADVFTVDVRFRRGAAWNCRGAADCGIHPLRDDPSEDSAVMRLNPLESLKSAPFDAEIVFTEATPSPPAAIGGDVIFPSHQ